MTTRRSALGRGLGALIPAAGAEPEPTATPPLVPGPAQIAIDAIVPNPDQPRRVFDGDHLAELAGSIRRHGVLQPIVVRRASTGGYELVMGERRWRACRAAGLETVPAVIADVEPQDRLELAIVENVQRHDLNPIELAHAYRALAEAGATQEAIGERVGIDRSSVANHLRLLELPREFQEDVEARRLSMGHAKALLQVTSPERRRALRDRILRDQLSVRASEKLAQDYRRPAAAPKEAPASAPAQDSAAGASDPRLVPLAETLRRELQTQVRIKGDTKGGHIEIDYFGAEDLERLCDALLRGA
jgi:ParB family chromosome partitioning protein